jgi:hypothetical protein
MLGETRCNSGCKLGLLMQAELGVDPRHVNAHGVKAYSQPPRNDFGLVAGGDKNCNFEFAWSEQIDEVRTQGGLTLYEDGIGLSGDSKGTEDGIGRRLSLVERDHDAFHAAEPEARETAIAWKQLTRLED